MFSEMLLGFASLKQTKDFIGGIPSKSKICCAIEMFHLGYIKEVHVEICSKCYKLAIECTMIIKNEEMNHPIDGAAGFVMDEINWDEEVDDEFSIKEIGQSSSIQSAISEPKALACVNSSDESLNVNQELPEDDWRYYIQYQEIASRKRRKKPIGNAAVESNDWNEGYEVDPLKYFLKFNEALEAYPDQCIRYGLDEMPLFYTQPQYLNCCNSEMGFFCQFMPYVLDLLVYDGLNLDEICHAMDFGTVIIFQCKMCKKLDGIVQRDV
jgi:hypothetical protein